MRFMDIILIILALISVGVVVWYFMGDSPTFLEALIVLVLTLVFVINAQLIKNSMRLNLLEKNIADSFIKIKDDINLIKSDMGLIKKKLKV